MNSTEPIAVTTGYYGGQPTVRTLDKSLVLPVGLALYPQPAAQGCALDVVLLDWLNENIFYREMGEWDAKYGHGDGYNMWVLFAPKGVRGSARTIISAARAAQEGNKL